MRENFIKTKDEDTYKLLLSHDFVYLGKDGDFYCFINERNKLNFDIEEYKGMLFTNLISL